MPANRSMPLVAVPPDQIRRVAGLPAPREYKSTFPKRSTGTAADARAALKRWQKGQPDPREVRNPDVPVKAVKPTRAALGKLRAVAESDVAPAELLSQRMGPEALFGTLYGALTAFEFMKLQAEYKRRRSAGRGAEKTEKEWREVVRAAQLAYAAGGLRAPSEAELGGFVRELTASRANLDAVVRIANSAVPVDRGTTLTAGTRVSASLVPVLGKFIDPDLITVPVPDICATPISQGTFTKHFSRSVSLSVKIKYWCPTWSNPFRTCTKTVTLAGVSFTIGLNVGYKVTCCGATAWGQAYAQACGTIIGITVCASCSASVVGVAGVSRTPVAGGCAYGLGVSAVLQCKFAGATILYLSIPFGWTVTGPCPPPGACA